MSDIVLATGVQLARDLPAGATRIPRQEWLGPASPPNRSTDDGEGSEPSTIRLVGHKVLAQGAGRTPRNLQGQEAARTANPGRDIEPPQVPSGNTGSPNLYTASATSASYANRAIATFSQQFDGVAATKGTYVDTYA
jgi:hypothetical protein